MQRLINVKLQYDYALKSVGVHYVMFKIFLSSATINKCHTIRLCVTKGPKEPNTCVTKSSRKNIKNCLHILSRN